MSELRDVPYWEELSLPRQRKLDHDDSADAVVVGGGNTGLVTAYLLAAAGKSVAVLERAACARIDTGHTSAHLTMVTDHRLRKFVKILGRDHAQAVWDAGFAAIAQIERIVVDHEIDAGFDWVDGYLHLPIRPDDASHRAELETEVALAQQFGFDAEFVDAAPLVNRPAARFGSQARIHPRRYLAGLLRVLDQKGVRIFEHSEATKFVDTPRAVEANGCRITCDDIVITTHNPLLGLSNMVSGTLAQTKLALYTSYVVAGRVAKGAIPDALWWDTSEPYYYLRIDPHREHDVVIFGGADHKTGQADDTEACYRQVAERLGAYISGVEITHRWSGQVIDTPDGLPYIGETAPHQYAATGFVGNGLTFGTVAGLIIADAVMKVDNPWQDLFSPTRKALGRSTWNYLSENKDYPYYLIRDRLFGVEQRTLRSIKRGQGAIVERDGQKVAVSRDEQGRLLIRSAVCTHMGCLVRWNTAERTWDCPCHGSRFTPDGQVISGPAETQLGDA